MVSNPHARDVPDEGMAHLPDGLFGEQPDRAGDAGDEMHLRRRPEGIQRRAPFLR